MLAPLEFIDKQNWIVTILSFVHLEHSKDNFSCFSVYIHHIYVNSFDIARK